MCGITGILKSGTNRDAWEQTLALMTDSLRHRGPDDAGIWHDAEAGIGLGHRRLSILDLSQNGRQPMVSASGRYVITYNGEIYNHGEIRDQLEREGKAFRGHSDTETLLASLDCLGLEKTLAWLNGMFAFALWDRQERRLQLVRDRLGEKPLYYGFAGPAFVFGSELKALRSYSGFSREIDRSAVALLLRCNCIPAPYSIYRGIRKLMPGTLLTIGPRELRDRTLPEPVSYWSLQETVLNALREPFRGSEREAIDELEVRLLASVRSRMLSDVPLGAFLSGGIDSSAIAAMMQAHAGRPVRTFSIGYREAKFDEGPDAAAVARHLGTEHTAFQVNAADALNVIPLLPALYDEPFADSSQIPSFLVSKLARAHVTVSLTGDGGDELFGGYNRHYWGAKVLRAGELLPGPLRGILAASLSAVTPGVWDAFANALSPLLPARYRFRMPGDKIHKFAETLTCSTPDEIYRSLTSHWKNTEAVVCGAEKLPVGPDSGRPVSGITDPALRMIFSDFTSYLPDDILVKLDRAGMGAGLEVRPPFLDHTLVAFSWRLPLKMKIRDGRGKWILRKVLSRYVPDALVERPKMGFGVPIDSWLRGPLREWAEALLAEDRLRREGFFVPQPVRRKWEEHLSGKKNWQYHLWDVLMFQAWLESEAAGG